MSDLREALAFVDEIQLSVTLASPEAAEDRAAEAAALGHLAEAARRFLALTETGQVEWRCELTRVTEAGEVKGVLPGSQTWQECFERRIHQKSYSCGWAVVIPADYPTEEGP